MVGVGCVRLARLERSPGADGGGRAGPRERSVSSRSARSAFVRRCFVLTPLCSRRVLLRVRMLYYLKQEVIGEQFQKVLGGADSR